MEAQAFDNLLTGNDLTLDKLWSIAVDNAEVEIAAEADARLGVTQTCL